MQLADSKHEQFAVHRAAGKSLAAAARLVGYSTSSAANMGMRLSRLVPIATRIAELQAQNQIEPTEQMLAGNRPWLKSKLIEIVQIGMNKDTRDLSNARMALDSLAKLQGFITTETRSIKEVHSFDHTSQPNHIISILKQQYGELDSTERKRLQLEDPTIIDALVESEEL